MALSNETILDVAKNVATDVMLTEHHGDVTLTVRAEHLIDVLTELKEHPDTAFDQLIDVTAIDWARPGERFDVVYLLYSLANKARVRVKVGVREDHPHVPTAVDVWEGANWYERETFDMYGIIFDGHPDLRRFYMPEDFMDENGEPLYPLRKDFPLMGIPGSLPLPPKGDMQQN
jgi:NADH-quinone oxidoreductase subunit C